MLIALARAVAMARQIGKRSCRDVVGHFESEAIVLRRVRHQPLDPLWRREAVVAGVHADCGEDFSVLAEAFAIEARCGKLAARQVALRAVERAQPAFVFPGGRADVDVIRRQPPQPSGEQVSIKLRRVTRCIHDSQAQAVLLPGIMFLNASAQGVDEVWGIKLWLKQE